MNYLDLFEQQEPDLVSKMKEINHGFKNSPYNPYHMEGSIWNHTKMVYDAALSIVKNHPDKSILLLAAILHDVGKVFTYYDNENTSRRSFYNHESVSTYYSMRFLKNILTNHDDIKMVMTLVSAHTIFHNLSNENIDQYVTRYGYVMTELGYLFNICDRKGRITEKPITSNDGVDVFKATTNQKSQKFNNLTILIGPPGSGKSSYVRSLKEKSERFLVIISRDSLVEKYGSGKTYQEKFKSLTESDHKKIDNELMREYFNSIRNNRDVVVDMTNMSKKSRKKFLRGYNNLKTYNTNAIVFLTDIDTLIERRSGDKYVPKEVILSMINRFNMPALDEFDNVELEIT